MHGEIVIQMGRNHGSSKVKGEGQRKEEIIWRLSCGDLERLNNKKTKTKKNSLKLI